MLRWQLNTACSILLDYFPMASFSKAFVPPKNVIAITF